MLSPNDLLAQNPLFSSLSPQHREQIAARLTRHEIAPNTAIVRQGDPADALFLIESGLVGVFVKDNRLGMTRLVHQLEAPESFGEMALVTAGPRNASCTALEHTVVQRLGREVFDAVTSKVPGVALAIARVLAERLQKFTEEREVPWVSLANRAPDRRLWTSSPEQLLRKHKVVPIEMDKHFLTVGMVDPDDTAGLQALRQAFSGVRFKVVAISSEDYERFIASMGTASKAATYAGKAGEAIHVAPEQRPQITFVEDDETRGGRASRAQAVNMTGSQVVTIVDEIVGTGLAIGASDIHIEHERKILAVRYRVDGALRPRAQPLPPDVGKPLVSRIKLLAKLDITETRRPQDGRISLQAGKRMVDLRVSTMPSKFGEKVVLRILDAEANVTDLKSLLVFEPVRQLFSEMIFRPHGLVLVTGPTGSGKTTDHVQRAVRAAPSGAERAHGRRPDRISPRWRDADPGASGDHDLREHPARDAAPRPGRDHGRRDARPRDRAHGGRGVDHRSLGADLDAHQQRARGDVPFAGPRRRALRDRELAGRRAAPAARAQAVLELRRDGEYPAPIIERLYRAGAFAAARQRRVEAQRRLPALRGLGLQGPRGRDRAAGRERRRAHGVLGGRRPLTAQAGRAQRRAVRAPALRRALLTMGLTTPGEGFILRTSAARNVPSSLAPRARTRPATALTTAVRRRSRPFTRFASLLTQPSRSQVAAWMTSSAAVEAPSFSLMRVRWVSTVLRLMCRCTAISADVTPVPIKRKTSSSRLVSRSTL